MVGASTSDIVFGDLCFGAISCGVGYRICFVGAGCYSDDMASIFANKVNKDYWDNSKISCTNTIREISD